MKIQYIKVKFNGTYQYKYKEFHHCCEEMEKHTDQFFLTGKYEDLNCEDEAEEYRKNIPKMCLYREDTYTHWEEEYTDQYYYPIKFCPFCGEQYKYKVINEADYSDLYLKVVKKRKEYWKEHTSCDSIKKSEKLIKIVKKHDDLISEFYTIGQFKELTMADVERLEE